MLQAGQPPVVYEEHFMPPRPTPHIPTQDELDGWMQAAEQREPPRFTEITQFRTYLHAKSPRRWRRIQKDYDWMQAQLIKLGVNPEDVRWIL